MEKSPLIEKITNFGRRYVSNERKKTEAEIYDIGLNKLRISLAGVSFGFLGRIVSETVGRYEQRIDKSKVIKRAIIPGIASDETEAKNFLDGLVQAGSLSFSSTTPDYALKIEDPSGKDFYVFTCFSHNGSM